MRAKLTDPPKFPRRLFNWYCGNAQVDDLLGDMDEIFHANTQRMPLWKARLKYWMQVFSLISSYAIRRRRQRSAHHPYSSNSINFDMIRNYFQLGWRMILKNKVYTVINVLGLSLGISACLIVFLVVHHEFSFDNFHPDKERIYRLRTAESAHDWLCDCVPAPAYTTIRDDYAGAEALTGYHGYDAKVTIVDNGETKNFERNTANIILTNPDYFRIFQYTWIAGDRNALARPMQGVLTESRARIYFGSISPEKMIGKTIVYNDSLNVTVGGVVKDWNRNSDLARTEFISFSTIENSFIRNLVGLDNWGMMMHSSQSFIKIKAGDNPGVVAAEMTKVIRRRTSEPLSIQLQALTDMHFRKEEENESSLLSTLYVLTGLASFILMIAAINFINLSTAQSISRSKEIGIRKVVGSSRMSIIVQFLTETIVLSAIALTLSLVLMRPLLFAFSSWLPAGLRFDVFSIENWLFATGLLVVIAVLSGFYPAVVISSHLPKVSLGARKQAQGRSRWSLRKGLIVFQFSVSLFFIIATMVIGSQMDYIRNKDRGFSTSSVLTFRTNWRGEVSKVETLANRLRSIPGMGEVTMQGFTPMGFAQWTDSFEYTGNKEKIVESASIKSGDENYIPLYQIRLIAGRNYYPSDSVREVVVNMKLSKRLGFNNPADAIGEQLLFNGKLVTICGVAEDFHQQSFRAPIGFAVIGNFKDQQHSISVKLKDADVPANTELIAKIESTFKEVYPDEPFDYHFLDDEIGWMHGEEQKTANLAAIAMGITIFISCMGVFGLAMFTAAMRTREIGIRKVLGASPVSLVNMLSREFVVLILISIVLATPIAWYYMNDWLLAFNYRTPLNPWFFVIAAMIALCTGLFTVSFQSMKAAHTDPVRALKTE